MLTARARAAQRTDPRKCRVTLRGLPKWSVVYENNPRIARPDEKGDFQDLPGRDAGNNRPYHLAKTSQRWTYNPAFRAERGELYLSEAERAMARQFAGRLVIEPHLKPGASPNKQWGWVRWRKLARMLAEDGLRPTQLGPPGTQVLDGAEFIVTRGFREACAVIAVARACVLPEGGLHHAAAALGVRAVVIFGGFTPVELTGYDGHINLGVGVADACGWRTPCAHCEAAMAAITPANVRQHLKEIL